MIKCRSLAKPLHTFTRAISTTPIMSSANKKIALVCCGSFSPITNMHLQILEAAKDHLTQDLGIPVGAGVISPVHMGYGKASLVSNEHRINMAKLATASSDWISVSDWEVKQTGWSPTHVALDAIENLLSKDGEQYCVKLMGGTDLLESFEHKSAWSDEETDVMMKRFGLVIIDRESDETKTNEIFKEGTRLSKYKDCVIMVPQHIFNNVSSSMIRSLLQKGRSIKYCVPDDVLDYIKKEQLYQT